MSRSAVVLLPLPGRPVGAVREPFGMVSVMPSTAGADRPG
jgi:hypothetical protein